MSNPGLALSVKKQINRACENIKRNETAEERKEKDQACSTQHACYYIKLYALFLSR